MINAIPLSSTIAIQAKTALEYNKKLNKNKKYNRKKHIKELKKYKEYIKKVLLDENYYEVTKDLALNDKLFPDDKKRAEIKKLVLNYKNSIDK